MSDTTALRPYLFSRLALALGDAAVSSETQSGIMTNQYTLQNQDVADDYVAKFINECQVDWEAYINHPFPKSLANDTANLNGYRHYLLQDANYLEQYYRLRLEAVAKTGTFNEMKEVAGKLAEDLDYVSSSRDELTTKFGIPKEVVATEEESGELLSSIALHNEVFNRGDWLDVNIVLLPCIWGYYIIGKKYYEDKTTITDSLYYSWIKGNAEWQKSAEAHKKYVNDSIEKLPEATRKDRWAKWIKYFKGGCVTEKAFFDLGTKPQAYDIVKSGNYTICISESGVKYYLAAKSATSVEMSKNSDTWTLTNSKDGYTFESVTQKGKFLTATKKDQTYDVTLTTNKQHWSINPPAKKGAPTTEFQIFIPGTTEYVLEGSTTKVSGAKNTQAPNQIWFLALQK